MQNDRTYIKLFRRIVDWEWYDDANTFRLFMHILLNANYTPSRYKGYDIPAGACVFGYHAWSEQLNMSVQQLRTAINHLKSTGEITIKTTNKFSIVTLEKWGFWQIEEGQSTSKTTSNQQTTNKQLTTSKEGKKVKTNIPTIEDVRAYVSEKGLLIDPDYFYEYYTTADWKDIKGNKIKNWKNKALTWNKRERDNGSNNDTTRSNRQCVGMARSVSGSKGQVPCFEDGTPIKAFRKATGTKEVAQEND